MKSTLRVVPALAVPAVIALAAGLATGARGGDDSPILTIMGQVHARNRALGKGLRATAAPDRKAMATDAESLIRLGKEARRLTEPARERGKSQQDWTRAVDDFLRASDELARDLAEPRGSRPRALSSYQKLQKTCVNCHSAFREEAD